MSPLAFAGLVGIIVGVWLILAIVRRPLLGVAIGLGAWAVEVTARGQTGVDAGVGLGVDLGATRVSIMDVSSLLLLGAVLMVLLRPNSAGLYERSPHAPKGFSLALLGLSVLWLITVVRGVQVNGLQTSINAGREMLNFIAYTSFGAVFGRLLTRRQIEQVWIGVAGVLSVMAALFVARNGFGSPNSSIGRSLSGGQAIIVANAMLLAALRPRPRPSHLVLAAGLGATILISQQRTVWATAVAALGIAAMVAIGRSGRLTRKWARFIVGLGTLGITMALLTLPDLARTVNRTSDVSAGSGTGGWRVESAFSVLRLYGDRDLNEQLIGPPSGASLLRRIFDGTFIDVSPHSTYLYALMTVGLVGLLCVLSLYISVLTKARKSPAVGYLFPLVASQLIFSIGYQVSPDQGMILGLFAAGAFVIGRARADRVGPGAENGQPESARGATNDRAPSLGLAST